MSGKAAAILKKEGASLQILSKLQFTEGISKKSSENNKSVTYVLGMHVCGCDNYLHLNDQDNQMFHHNFLSCHSILYYPHNKPGHVRT